MKNLLIFIFLTVSVLACGQTKVKSIGDKTTIDLKTVNYIEIRNHFAQGDTIEATGKRLTNENTKTFVDKWNNAKSKGICKYMVRYWIDVTLKDGSKRIFKINGQSIKEKTDYCFDLGDEKYILKLWDEAK